MTKRIVTNIYLDLAERSGQEHSKIEWEKPVPPTSKKQENFIRLMLKLSLNLYNYFC